jgi:anti-anti-sigma factor
MPASPPDAECFLLVLPETIDMADLPDLVAQAREAVAADGPVVVDCAAVNFLSTAVLQVLVALRRAVVPHGRTVSLEGVTAPAAAYLKLSGLDRVLTDSPPTTETP